MLNTHLHIVLRLRMRVDITSLPPYALMAYVEKVCFTQYNVECETIVTNFPNLHFMSSGTFL